MAVRHLFRCLTLASAHLALAARPGVGLHSFAAARSNFDECALLQVRAEIEEQNAAGYSSIQRYRAELSALSKHLDSAKAVFQAHGWHATSLDGAHAAGALSDLVAEAHALHGQLQSLLQVAEHAVARGAAGSSALGAGSPPTSEPSSDPWPAIGVSGQSSAATSKDADPADLTDPWPAVGAGSSDPWPTVGNASSSAPASGASGATGAAGSSSYLKNNTKKGSGPWLILVLMMAILFILAMVVVVSPFSVQEGLKGKAAAEKQPSSGMRSRFVQVAMPFWLPAAPNSCGLMFVVMFAGLMTTCASLTFWFSYVCIVLGRTLLPFVVRPDVGTPGHGCIGALGLRIFCTVGVFFAPVLFALRWKDVKTRLNQWCLLAVVLFMMLIRNAWHVGSSYITRIMMDAMFFSDATVFWHCYWVECGGLVFSTATLMVQVWCRSIIALQWRQYMTHHFLDLYMSRRSYYEIDSLGEATGQRIDNPDQRIQEDAGVFTVQLLKFVIDLLGSVISLVSFATILWNLRPTLTIVAIVYCSVGSVLGLIIAWKLVVINYINQKCEADFRYSLVHVRNNPEAIAFYGGEAREKRISAGRLDAVLDAIYRRIKWDTVAQGYMSFFTALAAILPPVLLFSAYFKGDLDFGSITQAGGAFMTTMTSLSFVITNMHEVADLSTAVNRLGSLLVLLKRPDEAHDIEVVNTQETRLEIKGLTANTPGVDRIVIRDLNMATGGSGDGSGSVRVLLVGASGVGKSSLLRVVAGLWKAGKGEVVRPPNSECLFLPQKPYMPLGDLRMQLTYPDEHDSGPEGQGQSPSRAAGPVTRRASDAELRSLLGSVGLEDLPNRFEEGFDGICDWGRVLSVGEQQRLATVRIFLRRPKLTILDEATSALSVPDEMNLYERLQASNLSYLSVGHRDTLIKYHDEVIELTGNGEWRRHTGDDYAKLQAKKNK